MSNCLAGITAIKYNKRFEKNHNKKLNFEKNHFREFPILKITKCHLQENEMS